MIDQQPWNKQDAEPAIWFRRFERYLLLFPRRSVAAVYSEEHPKKNKEKQRTNPGSEWYDAAKQWKWEERALAYDDALFAEEEKEAARVRRSGFALQHKRILALQTIADKLMGYLDDEKNLWMLDVKSIGTGPDAERVDLVQFNDPLLKEIREYLTDIADEVGGRVKKTETAITSLPKEYVGFDPDMDGSEA